MFNTVLNKICSELEQKVLRSLAGTGFNKVHFLNLKANEDRLHPNSVNVVLFGTTAERSIMGSPTFSTPTTNDMGIEQKPPLKLSVDVLLIFNYNLYKAALETYSQVLGYFYNYDLMDIPYNGYPNQVQILLSSFNDRDEIELWNTFGMAGTPVLRYNLKYLMLSGKTKELPVVRKVSIDGGVLNPEETGISALVLNMIYYPIDVILKGITQKTNSFCSIQFTGDEAIDNAEIKRRYTEITTSYVVAEGEIVKLKAELTVMMSEQRDPAYPVLYKKFNPFFPSIDGLLKALVRDREELEQQGTDPSVENYDMLCALAQSFTHGSDSSTQSFKKWPDSLTQSFLQQLSITSKYLLITTALDDQIARFDAIGVSTYGKTDATASAREDLGLVQLRMKWWELEDALKLLSRTYSEEEKNELLQIEEQAYIDFIDLLDTCQRQLSQPIETFSALNNQFNQGSSGEINPIVSEAYFRAYQSASEAVNFLIKEPIPIRLAEGLQRIFENQNNNQ